MTVEIVSASAGSGKTYRLASALQDALTRASNAVAPEAVLATTFTNKAAAELQERARRFLLRNGHAGLARRLAAARFGTVNAVCGRLVSDFAFELGRPPEQGVLDEPSARVALRRALTRVVTVDETLEIAELEARLDQFRILDGVESMIAMARANRVPAAAFHDCGRRSRAELRSLLDDAAASRGLDPERASAAALDRELREALEAFVEAVEGGLDRTKGARDAAERAGRSLARLRNGLRVRWDEWAWLAKAPAMASSRRLMENVHAAAEGYLVHPQLRRDLDRVSELVCDLATRGLDAYQEYKRANGLLDFVDQEALALDLLERAEVRERLRGELGTVLVDEFQDTSPLQLAIFLALAEIAPESLWVGDQKQSIFAFRGSDPGLMESAMETLLGGREPQTLGRSYRSRPELVRVTSEIFVRAFSRHGLPEPRVRLEAACEEPRGLGPFAERWRLDAGKADEDAAALAAAVGELLADPEVRVRDPLSGEVRRAEPRDVAILCRRRVMRDRVAAALAARGIRSVVPRSGLVSTAEGQAVLAGLRLWSDPRDRLAAAALARLLELPGDGDAWLAAALAPGGAERFVELPGAARLLARRQELPAAGALQALDVVLETLALRERCADWGETASRLANLDALHAHAVVFADLAAAEGGGATPAGLVAHLERLADDGEDAQATLAARDAVVVSTWHGAKGLEWPIVVLFELDKEHEPGVFGVSIESDAEAFDARSPLAGRWLRLWPEIFHPMRTRTAVHERLAEHPVAIQARARRDAEDLRLLYVGWTRARDRVVLAGRRLKLLEGTLRHLRDEHGPLLDDPESGPATWAGIPVEIVHRSAAPLPRAAREAEAGSTYAASGPREHPPAWLQPSGLETPGEVVAVEELGARLALHGAWDEARLGEAVHRFFAADRRGLEVEPRRALAERILAAWELGETLDAETLLNAADRLRAFLDRRFPGARWRREWPLARRDAGGTVLRGAADLILDTEHGFAVVDHKTFAGSPAAALERARGHAAQVHAYATAYGEATGKPLLGAFIHLPVGGRIVEVAAP